MITLPPLRVRDGDIGVLAEYFGRRMAAEIGWEDWPGFARHVEKELEDYAWPGNVRELRNVVERAIYRWGNANEPVGYAQFDPFDSPWKPAGEKRAATPEHGRAQRSGAEATTPRAQAIPIDDVDDLRGAVELHERTIVEHALGRHRWNQRQTAKALGLTYDQLRHCIKKHGLAADD